MTQPTPANPRITVLGTGYVGLVTGACLANLGWQVTGYDVQEAKIEKLRRGENPIYEPGLEELLAANKSRLSFTSDLDAAISSADVIFVCVGTPQGDDGRADLSQVEAVARTIAGKLDRYRLIVEKSTVPVRTAERIAQTIRMHAPQASFDVASNPEFLREGSAIADFQNPDRIVIGVGSDRASQMLRAVYAPLKATIVETSVATAEIIKHASNSFLATKISFINMVADLCEKTGADVREVAEGMGYDKRIGRAFLNAGIGYGGSCFPKDVLAFTRIAEDHRVDFSLLEQVHKINQARIDKVFERLKDMLWVLRDKRVALLGLAFKPNTDDIREAPALKIIQRLHEEGARIAACDPQALENVRRALGNRIPVDYCASAEAAAQGADALLLVTEWSDYTSLDPARLRSVVRTPVVFDGRNALNKPAWEKAGFAYRGVGFI